MANGTLFTEDFLHEGIDLSPSWAALSDAAVARFAETARAILAGVVNPSALNEAQTEERIIRPVLLALGWGGAFSVQSAIGRKGRANVPDYTLFATQDAFARADAAPDRDAALKHAVAVGDAKAWTVGLDQSDAGAGKGETPAAQVLR